MMGNNTDDDVNEDSFADFYEKLLATDAQIQKLRKTQESDYGKDLNTNLNENYYPRYKRSLWKFRRPFARFRHAKDREVKKKTDLRSLNATVYKTEFPTTITREENRESNWNRRKVKAIRKLRQINFNVRDDPSKILIHKKDIIAKFHPAENDRRSKCTHVTSESKSHEKNLKHPFYKNSQRLDELLDQLLDKNLNDVMADPLQKDALSKQNHDKQVMDRIGTEADESKLLTPKPPSDNLFGRLFKNKFKKLHETKNNKGGSILSNTLDEFLANSGDLGDDSTTSSTSLDSSTATEKPEGDKNHAHVAHDSLKTLNHNPAVIIVPHKHQISHLRHLLQTDDAYDSSLHLKDEAHRKQLWFQARNLRHLLQADDGYDSSLHYTDGKEVFSDEMEPHDDMEKRRQRAVVDEENPASSKQTLYINPNWKGPMPLYFDEIQDMIFALPAPKGQKGGKKQLRSTEMFEDYDNKDTQAQAYSDYGVLEGKKNSPTTQTTEITDILSKYNFKRDLQVQVPEEPNTSNDTSNERQKARKTFLTVWGGRLGKLIKVKPDEVQEDADFSDSLNEQTTSTNKTEGTELKQSNSYKSRTLVALSFRSRDGDGADAALSSNDDDDDNDDDERRKREEDRAVKIASLKIIKKREADIPKFELVDKTKNFNESDNLLSMLSQWFGKMAVAANGSDCRGENKDGQQSSASPTTESNKYSQITQHSKQRQPYFSRPESWKPRSLLSIEEDKVNEDKNGNNTEAVSDGGVDKNLNKTKDEAKISTVPETTTNNYTESTLTTIAVDPLNSTETSENKVGKKPVVKRSAPVEENGLTFWNDLYDDEYGVQVDSVNEPMGSARSANLDSSARPENWLRKKYRSIKNMVHYKRPDGQPVPAGIRTGRDTNDDGGSAMLTDDTKTSPKSEDTPTILKTQSTERPVSFEELTVKMKDVVSQAVKAVEETNTARAPTTLPIPDIEANDTEPDVGGSLMRQLMRMMSDVMDYQVHARTCLQPPEDLRVFLVQLTAPDPGRRLRDEDDEDMGYRSREGYISDDEMFSQNPTDLHLSQAREQENSQNIKNDCQDTLKTVEGLMMEYDMLSDEEKKSMTEVKEYLQNQLDFLRTQCFSHSDFSFDLTPYYQDSMPVRRVKRRVYKSNAIKNMYTGKRKKNIGRIMKFWSKQPESTPDAGSLTTDSSEYTFKDSIRNFYNADTKLLAAKNTYDMGIKQLSDLNFDIDYQNDKPNAKISNSLQKGLINSNNTFNKNLRKYTVPPKAEDIDTIFQVAIQDPAFRDTHKIDVVYLNDAKRRYERILREYQAAKDRFDKSTSLYNQHREELERSIKQIELATKIYRDRAADLKQAYVKFSKAKKRNLNDVYYRAVSEAKKLTAKTESATSSYILSKAMTV